jgi:putative exosortase-associated protein (TIGR04073 family)
MKRVVLVLLLVAFTLIEVSPGYCETPAFRKFRRGFCNLFTFHLELFNQIELTQKKEGSVMGWTVGVLKGVGMVGMRALVGAYEVATFPIPFPPKYEPILKEPEFFWSEPFAENPAK